MLRLSNIIDFYGIKNKRIKVIRHSLSSDNVALKKHFNGIETSYSQRLLSASDKLQSLRTSTETLMAISSEQAEDRFKDTNLIIVFCSTGSKSAEFLGCFEVIKKLDMQKWLSKYESIINEAPAYLSENFTCADRNLSYLIPEVGLSSCISDTNYFYDLCELDSPINKELKRRLIIEWKSPVSWVQTQLNQRVLEIRPQGFIREWNGFYNFVLPLNELTYLVENSLVQSDWEKHLSSISGVYLIVDQNTGKQYVGSAYGQGGVWSRWVGYAKTGHNNNKLLKDEFVLQGAKLSNWQFSMLKVMDKTASVKDVIAQETLFKQKLGSRVFGLNAN